MGLFKLSWCHWAETRLLSLFWPQQLPSSWPFCSNREPEHWNIITLTGYLYSFSALKCMGDLGRNKSELETRSKYFSPSYLSVYLSTYPCVCIHIHAHVYIHTAERIIYIRILGSSNTTYLGEFSEGSLLNFNRKQRTMDMKRPTRDFKLLSFYYHLLISSLIQ